MRFRIGDRYDADDVLQETYLAAYLSFDRLQKRDGFKAWLIGIARNKCRDYFREKAKRLSVPIDDLTERISVGSRFGITESSVVGDTLEKLGDKDKQILYLYYWKELPQEQIAARLSIPLGTVKSRLHHAKSRFREEYPCPPNENKKEGSRIMKKFPEFLPEYTIEKSDQPVFPVKWEEIMGWFIVPKLGEKLSWAMYDQPDRRRGEVMEMAAVGRAEVHGIEGVEIAATEYDPVPCNSAGGQNPVERRLVAQLTDTHCRILAESHTENGVKKYYTFLDGDPFLDNWGFGENNCGNEVNLSPKGDIVREGNAVTTADKPFLLDIVGRYTVTVGGKLFDTVCVIDVQAYMEDVVSEQFLDRNGRTVLWRRFNRDDWRAEHYGKRWSELLPDSDRLIVNGKTFVHWYDCVPDWVLG